MTENTQNNIDYKKYWQNDELKNIIPQNHGEFPEGWNPAEFLQEVVEKLDFESVLDFGCGYGRLCKAFDPQFYTGIDLNPNAVAKAKELNENYNFLEINVDSEYSQADLTMAYTVFLHLDDETLLNILERLRKTTKKYLIIAEILGREWRRAGTPPVFNRNKEDYVQLAASKGFEFAEEHKRAYARYANNPEFQDKNTDLSILVFKCS